MKVTALIPDPLVADVRSLAQGKSLTDSLVLALSEWTETRKSLLVADKVKAKPLSFRRVSRSNALRRTNRSR
jgi:hypothetical protein